MTDEQRLAFHYCILPVKKTLLMRYSSDLKEYARKKRLATYENGYTEKILGTQLDILIDELAGTISFAIFDDLTDEHEGFLKNEQATFSPLPDSVVDIFKVPHDPSKSVYPKSFYLMKYLIVLFSYGDSSQ